MPSWNEVLTEIQIAAAKGQQSPLDVVRKEYLAKLHNHTGRNVIAYYSGWLQKAGNNAATAIGDDDKNAFMAAIHKLDRSKGLDLLLHTPGGDLTATESIVDYLHRMFDRKNIRAIVPQLAMSAGTMIACASNEIVLGKQSSLGPIDPQLRGVPAHGVVAEIKRAFRETKKDKSKAPIWGIIIDKYHPTFVGECEHAIQLSSEMVSDWLEKGMFSGDPSPATLAKKTVGHLNNHRTTRTHSRHLNIDQAKKFGLKVVNLEDDDTLQDLVLTVHHCYMHTFGNTAAIKIVENHIGNAVLSTPGVTA